MGRKPVPQYGHRVIIITPFVAFALWLSDHGKTRVGHPCVRAATQEPRDASAPLASIRRGCHRCVLSSCALAGLWRRVQCPKAGACLLMDFRHHRGRSLWSCQSAAWGRCRGLSRRDHFRSLTSLGVTYAPQSTLFLNVVVMGDRPSCSAPSVYWKRGNRRRARAQTGEAGAPDQTRWQPRTECW